jgi:hypothetical protein
VIKVPIKKVRWLCSICSSEYEKESSAQQCEDRGVPKTPPIGMIYGDNRPNSFYANITFAIAKSYVKGHSINASSWACRDNCYGDNYGDDLCGSGDLNGIPDANHPTFIRMVKYLVQSKIPVTIFNGKGAISLSDFLEEHKEDISIEIKEKLERLVEDEANN